MAFTYIPTGIYPTWALRVNMFIRHETNTDLGPKGMDWDIPADRSALVRLPDRTILITNPIKPWEGSPIDGHWDEVMEFDPYRGDWGESFLKYVMLSAWNGMTTQSGYGTSTGVRDRNWITNGVKLFGDSGGSQLKSGTTDYVDPKAAIVWMNQVCNIGVPLDVAPHLVDQHHPEVWPALIELQKRHNKVFLDSARPDREGLGGLKLLNCAHGFTIPQVRKWCDETHDDRFIGWAVGGDVADNLFQHMRTLILCIQEYNRWGDEAHYHSFGSANITKTPAMAWLGRYVKNLTGDGTGWLDGVKYHRAKYLTIGGGISTQHFGRKSQEERTAIIGSSSPCSCPICAATGGHWQVFSLPRCTPGPNVQLLHEIWTTVRASQMWSDLAMNATSIEDYIKWVEVSFAKGRKGALAKQHVRDVIQMVKYVHVSMEHGVEYADRKFAQVLNNEPRSSGNMNPLFMRVSSKRKDTFGGSYVQPPIRKSVLPNYLTRAEMRELGLRTDDLKPGVAEGYPAKKGHARGGAQEADVASIIRL